MMRLLLVVLKPLSVSVSVDKFCALLLRVAPLIDASQVETLLVPECVYLQLEFIARSISFPLGTFFYGSDKSVFQASAGASCLVDYCCAKLYTVYRTIYEQKRHHSRQFDSVLDLIIPLNKLDLTKFMWNTYSKTELFCGAVGFAQQRQQFICVKTSLIGAFEMLISDSRTHSQSDRKNSLSFYSILFVFFF